MPLSQQPLTTQQQDLVLVVKAAHQNLALARKTRQTEQARRIQEFRIRMERELEIGIENIRRDMDYEVAAHESALDEAIIAAFNDGVPVRRIALDGFGNRYDGGASQLIAKLRADGRVGVREGYQRNTGESDPTVSFPKAVDVEALIDVRTTVDGPRFADMGDVMIDDDFSVRMVSVNMDSRDPYFNSIAKQMRPGTQYARATSAMLYLGPDNLIHAQESEEVSDQYWDHPVARWVKDHQAEAFEGYRLATSSSAE